ncbi:hypothetical protein N7466_001403 [Penicillium verhagenii]|uniref:uncharacterized protein n=1 Tax=Penicillium verhagenii TaxID=1562060 RepID=UPI002545A6D0|nr:uncharacterized protein N7466_001403 [Penicillium verhagenii]KAJ5948388.1 hypothetical protein N7466_001403 [Penicillium verhagenii]
MPNPHPIQESSREASSLFLFHHIFLPPRLPQSSDFNPENDILLLKAVIDALDGFRVDFHDEELAALKTIHTMIVRLKQTCSSDGNLLESELYKQFDSLKKQGGLLPIYVREQNAGVLFTTHEDTIHVESFELSPRNSPVTMTTGRLIRTFPGPAISIDQAIFNDPALQMMVAQTLTKMSYQAAPGTKAKVKKAQQTHDEDRDTTDPKMVTEFLMAMLHPLGSSLDTLQLQKLTREEVMWCNSRSPWRRSSLWLFIRVLIQLVLMRLSVEENTFDLYKQFIIYFMCSTLRTSLEFTGTPSEEIYLMNAKISRRLMKLDLPKEPTWFASAQRTLSQATQIINFRWKNIIEKRQPGPDELPLTTLNFDEDTQCKFPTLDRFVQCIRNRKSGRPPVIPFQPELQLLKTQPSILPTLFHSVDGDYHPYNLAIFENWVALNLDAWMDTYQQDQATCSRLSALIMEYSRAVKACNQENPESSSVMLLTILELWVACDKSAVLAHNILREYDPCLPADIFQPLLLPFKSQMLRLSRAEEYLRERQKLVQYRGPGIFSDFGTSDCFSVRYFDQSEEHRLLYERIEQKAQRDRMCKQRELPRSIEVFEQKAGRFPRIRLLSRDAEERLFNLVLTYICDNGLDSLPISRQPVKVRNAVRAYVLNPTPTDYEVAIVEDDGPAGIWTESNRSPLLLLRGLFAEGVLSFCLGQKRWRVNYGPDSNRTPQTKLCVPYRAKDNPSPRSEFSHPDVIVILTCLAYYYAGLDDEDMFLVFNHLVQSDQACIVYQLWVDDSPMLPREYHQLLSLNLDDRNHCTSQIFPAFRFSKATIDYFLEKFVFPREMKEFPSKLSASGWDLGKLKQMPTVGFSGTNDSRKTLPLSVKQLDLPRQNHTNALVLEYLLRPENGVALISCQSDPCKTDAQELLEFVMSLSPPAQVILDVGAQILELSNSEVATQWLEMISKDSPVQAVVFVNDQDVICVIDRKGRVESLQTSPFARQLEVCFIFLDEAHTRGIDLKLPITYRAAVTLGPRITKDKLVQACMRMRELGRGQSVVFCIPDEINAKILALSGKETERELDASDVVIWAVSETWADMQRTIPLWAVQGSRFYRQDDLWERNRHAGLTPIDLNDTDKFLEPESQTLERRYRPGCQQTGLIDSTSVSNSNLRLIMDRCDEFQCVNFSSSTLQEEQERELAPEIECEHEIERPPQASPAVHRIHPHLRTFIRTGALEASSDSFKPAFHVLQNTSAASLLGTVEFPTDLLVTTDFATTVDFPAKPKFVADAFQRPVRWILTAKESVHPISGNTGTVMLIISPFEANSLMMDIRKSTVTTLHSYSPRQNREFPPLDHLTLHIVPRQVGSIFAFDSLLQVQLNLFSGQLYLESYSQYQYLCEFLGVASVKTPEGLVVAADGFIEQGGVDGKSSFRKSPLGFLQILMSQIRKDCQDIGKTHIGKILRGQLLTASDFPDTGALLAG